MDRQQPPPFLHLVEWYQRPSGIYVRGADLGTQERILLALNDAPAEQTVFAVLHRLPNFMERVLAFLDEELLGLTPSSPDQIRAAMSTLNFETAAIGLAAIQQYIDDTPKTPEAQRDIAETLFRGMPVLETILETLRKNDSLVVLAEQNLTALQRLAVLHGDDAQAQAFTNEASALFSSLWIASSALSMSREEFETGEPPEDFDTLTHLVQNGAFNSRDSLLESFARTRQLFMVLARSKEARDHTDYCDIAAWVERDQRLPIDKLMAVGLAALATSKAMDSGPPREARTILSPGWLGEAATRGHIDMGIAEEVLTAPREWYVSEFQSLEERFDVPPQTAQAGWNRVPFETKPFLRLKDGRSVLWSPRVLTSWMTEGFYWRAFTSASERGDGDRFRRFYGWLVEQYVVQLFKDAYPEPRPEGAGRAHGEVEYSVRRQTFRSPDVAVDCDEDLVFVEVTSGRLRFDTMVSGNPESLRGDLERLFIGKSQQLSRRIDHFIDGEYDIPGVDRTRAKRIWPVVVAGAGLTMSEPLWDYLINRISPALTQAAVQPLTLLDIGDVELLAGLLERGSWLPELLRRKTGGYRALDFHVMVYDDPSLDDETRLSAIESRGHDFFGELVTALGWDRAQFEADRDEHASPPAS